MYYFFYNINECTRNTMPVWKFRSQRLQQFLPTTFPLFFFGNFSFCFIFNIMTAGHTLEPKKEEKIEVSFHQQHTNWIEIHDWAAFIFRNHYSQCVLLLLFIYFRIRILWSRIQSIYICVTYEFYEKKINLKHFKKYMWI